MKGLAVKLFQLSLLFVAVSSLSLFGMRTRPYTKHNEDSNAPQRQRSRRAENRDAVRSRDSDQNPQPMTQSMETQSGFMPMDTSE